MHPNLARLVANGQIRKNQAQFIHDNWDESRGDLFAQPQVREIEDHTRTYIDQLRGHFRSAIPFDEQEA